MVSNERVESLQDIEENIRFPSSIVNTGYGFNKIGTSSLIRNTIDDSYIVKSISKSQYFEPYQYHKIYRYQNLRTRTKGEFFEKRTMHLFIQEERRENGDQMEQDRMQQQEVSPGVQYKHELQHRRFKNKYHDIDCFSPHAWISSITKPMNTSISNLSKFSTSDPLNFCRNDKLNRNNTVPSNFSEMKSRGIKKLDVISPEIYNRTTHTNYIVKQGSNLYIEDDYEEIRNVQDTLYDYESNYDCQSRSSCHRTTCSDTCPRIKTTHRREEHYNVCDHDLHDRRLLHTETFQDPIIRRASTCPLVPTVIYLQSNIYPCQNQASYSYESKSSSPVRPGTNKQICQPNNSTKAAINCRNSYNSKSSNSIVRGATIDKGKSEFEYDEYSSVLMDDIKEKIAFITSGGINGALHQGKEFCNHTQIERNESIPHFDYNIDTCFRSSNLICETKKESTKSNNLESSHSTSHSRTKEQALQNEMGRDNTCDKKGCCKLISNNVLRQRLDKDTINSSNVGWDNMYTEYKSNDGDCNGDQIEVQMRNIKQSNACNNNKIRIIRGEPDINECIVDPSLMFMSMLTTPTDSQVSSLKYNSVWGITTANIDENCEQ